MAKTRLAIRNRVKQKLNTVTGSVVVGAWGDELNEYITQAERKIAFDLPDCAIDDNLWGSSTYSLPTSPISKIVQRNKPADFLRLISAYHIPRGSNILRSVVMLPNLGSLVARIEISNNTTSGTSSTFFALHGKYVCWGPVSIGDSITIDYVRVPTPMSSDTSESQIPEQFIGLVEDHAVAMALLQVGSPAWQAWMERYQSGVVTLFQRFNLDPPKAFLPSTGMMAAGKGV
ncbi:MAG: hypothetical protein ABIK37_05210 [candidate division WOR-3 bacterium]